MSKFTLYRVDVDSPRLARMLGTVPGVAVEDERADDRGAKGAPSRPAGEATPPAASDEDGGLRAKIPVPGSDVADAEKASLVKRYGLLGLGVSMVMLGIATVGIWIYMRRTGSGDESETPPPATELDTGGTGSPVAETEPEPSTPAPAGDEADGPSEDRSAAEPDVEPHGRAEGDRTDIEWTTREPTPNSEPVTPDEPSVEDSTAPVADEADGDDERPTEPVDAAPLLGAAFLAVTGAVVKWLQAGEEA